ncbi:MAG: hypothetical protein I3273_01085 [Candidatus Moeniiplasma glomeromycotorum]|nr:hypothetical protein [Candidatus Moeniiplasma glomeromycotorum]MCE8167284.1 hypothetical protein [Candidatus Moeniiplasma glomeromycotorum]MCE8168703.1 hypothetical protein [Candidatus Moeniiplasma glomeromycotorum]
MRKSIKKKTKSPKTVVHRATGEFEKYIEEIERPEYDGPDISKSLPTNATPWEKAKYDICEKILAYQQDNNLSINEITHRLRLTTAETKDILHYRLECFTFKNLVTYLNRLIAPSKQVEIVIKEKKNPVRVR